MSVLCRIQLPFVGPGQFMTPLNPMVIRGSKPGKCNFCFQGLHKNGMMRSRVEVRGPLEKIAVQRLPLVSIKCVMTAGTALAAAATSGYLHAAVTSTITNVAITAVAIASGACLSTKIDCLWPRGEQGPDSVELDGVDITGYTIFNEPKVQKAVTFARKAHSGQTRKTGEPYLTHCIHTGKILAALVPSSGQRAVNTVVAGILHDVIDDTGENLKNVEQNFGDDVARLVAGVSKLSYINQLLRRHRRTNAKENASENGYLALAEVDNLRVMLLGMVNDPRVVLIKLADRLHNMRTIYALPPSKARAVAQETLAIWCSLASRLGLWAMKSELEDLCFAVLQPQVFRNLRAELAAIWMPSREQRYLRRIMQSTRHRRSLHDSKDESNLVKRDDFHTDDGHIIKELIQAVPPFELLLDRGKRSHILSNFAKNSNAESQKPKIVRDAEIAIASLTACEEAIEKELVLSTSYIPGMEVTLSGRLKSLYSTYCKMKRKGVSIEHIYDARALRVIVGDGGGKMHAAAIECCYSLLNVVHSLWTPLDGEFDDYIVNPKPSGYQSLHTAVKGPDGSPLEVQVRTQCMHESAEYGHAAHWLYKEARNAGRSISFPGNANNFALPEGDDIIGKSTNQETEKDADKEGYLSINSIRVGHPVLRVEDSRLLAAVVVRVDDGGKELLVAVSFALAASEAVAAGRLSNQTKRWEAYAKLYKKVSEKWWFAPGHGDWSTFIEKYVLCRDGIYHKQDQFQRSLPTFIQLLDLNIEENEEYWKVMSTVLEGKEVDIESSSSNCSGKSNIGTPVSALSTTTHLNNKVRLLRSMLEWEQQLRNEVVFGTASASIPAVPKSAVLTEVAIIRWPHGEIMRLKYGSTAADAARRLGLDGRFVFVNGQIALPHTQLKDGDVVEVRT
ncbi:hypothetical protein SUGI_0137250 [Cryptomeria japonica]|uniref:uncharacterized protein LOC131056066 n=1 Tax=Cryptomeria japonica TaxID=3369 RepID=UPI00240893A5|nr:uncharacterized protein LOC131056066 [Cryptomeria japonica]GLJ10884.1 hypothetical protein SUGI_0137250 [Cryptomeria japonica]